MDVENTRWWKLHNAFPWLLCASAGFGKYLFLYHSSDSIFADTFL